MLAALVVHFKDKGLFGGSSKSHSRVSSQDEEEDEDGENGDEDDDDEDGDEDDDIDEDDDEDNDGTATSSSADVEQGAVSRPSTMKAFVALGDDVHSITLPLDEIESWASLSQTIHETCEDSSVPDLPVHGIMHIVLNVNGKTVPVTGMTPLDELWKAKAIKVSITDEDQGSSGDKKGKEGKKGKKGKQKGPKR